MALTEWPQIVMAILLVASPFVALGAGAVQWIATEKKKSEILGFLIGRILGKGLIAYILLAGGFWA